MLLCNFLGVVVMAKFSRLYNFYWQIRYTRNKTVKRKYYRYAAAEKKRLIESGVDVEEIRVLCRHLSNLKNEQAEIRLEAYRKTLKSCRSSFGS